MKTSVLIIFLISSSAFGQSPTCHGKLITSEAQVLQILETSSPSAADTDTRKCISGAIDYAAELRSQAAIPQLVRYLSFNKGRPSQQNFALHLPIEGEDYPAVLALCRIGGPARPVLLKLIQSSSANLRDKENATHAILLSFSNGPEHDPGNGIIYLRKAEFETTAEGRNSIDQMISYALTTQVCKRFAPRCKDAMNQQITPSRK